MLHPGNSPMKVGVIGTGHVGAITCLSLASVGHRVVGCDADSEKVTALANGRLPFHEPGAEDLLKEQLAADRLTFTSEIPAAVSDAEVVFICVGTPPRVSGEANLLAVERAGRDIAGAATGPLVIVEKSTVPAGTAERLRRTLGERSDLAGSLEVVSNPEFLREGQALNDAFHPDRILVGASSSRAFAVMRQLYDPFLNDGVQLIETDITSAELAKHASNAFLALKISYANALARLCEASGADIEAVTRVMGADPRIGADFLSAGLGFGGYCLPKDLAAFQHLADRLGYPFEMLGEVARINDEAIKAAMTKIREVVWNLEGKRVALLGLAFKPDTDDVRFSPALSLARHLLAERASVVGYDPIAGAAARSEVPELELAADLYEAAEGASCVVVCTAWDELREIDLDELGKRMSARNLVDGRNLLNGQAAAEAGFTYRAMGRPGSSIGSEL
jgi:UDPglucose 6-dehydrogenase